VIVKVDRRRNLALHRLLAEDASASVEAAL
jgi:hypothetical protein